MKKKRTSNLPLIAVFFVGLSVLLYPTFSDWWNSNHQGQVMIDYSQTVSTMDPEQVAKLQGEAQTYNELLAEIGPSAAASDPELEKIYWETLDVSGTGIMGSISIEKLHVKLPIYHGTDESVLQAGAGHLMGTSLPIGGTNTHSVISAHRGLPSATMFTHLDRMKEGDVFTLNILDKILTYQVDQITVVLPDEVEDSLEFDADKDYCTLLTCTPYGINSHRMLVRGVRTGAQTAYTVRVVEDAHEVSPLLVTPAIAVPLMALMMGWMAFGPHRKKT